LGIYSKAFVGAVQRWQYMEMKWNIYLSWVCLQIQIIVRQHTI
jgi:hypothetical protein